MSARSVALIVQISLSAQPRVAVPEPAGLFFWLRPRFHADMDPELDNIIRQALADAQAAGRDYLGQTEKAIQAVRLATCFCWVGAFAMRLGPRSGDDSGAR